MKYSPITIKIHKTQFVGVTNEKKNFYYDPLEGTQKHFDNKKNQNGTGSLWKFSTKTRMAHREDRNL